MWLDGGEKVTVSQETFTHYFRVNRTTPIFFYSNLTLVAHYVTNYSSTATAQIGRSMFHNCILFYSQQTYVHHSKSLKTRLKMEISHTHLV